AGDPEKAAGHGETFGTDLDDPGVIQRELLLLAERTAGRLRSGAWLARTVTIKVRFADFATITRSRTLDVPTDVGQELYDTARALYDALGLDRARIRLGGGGRGGAPPPAPPPVRCGGGPAGAPPAPRRAAAVAPVSASAGPPDE